MALLVDGAEQHREHRRQEDHHHQEAAVFEDHLQVFPGDGEDGAKWIGWFHSRALYSNLKRRTPMKKKIAEKSSSIPSDGSTSTSPAPRARISVVSPRCPGLGHQAREHIQHGDLLDQEGRDQGSAQEARHPQQGIAQAR